jgi:hypothetical protein
MTRISYALPLLLQGLVAVLNISNRRCWLSCGAESFSVAYESGISETAAVRVNFITQSPARFLPLAFAIQHVTHLQTIPVLERKKEKGN